MNTAIVVSIDMDWAPDFMLEQCVQLLLTHRVPATFFVTHETAVLNLLRKHCDLFELGIHPNLLPGSSHGSTAEGVMAHCMQIVPEAQSIRTHSLVQSNLMLVDLARNTSLEYEWYGPMRQVTG